MPLNFLWNSPRNSIKYAVFDLDGTLLDSMGYWRNLGSELLLKRGLPAQKNQRISIKELASKIEKATGERIIPWDLWEEGMELMRFHYENDVGMKPFAMDYLRQLKENGIPFCIATATDREICMPALKRHGIDCLAEFILTCKEAGADKSRPDIYFQSAKRLGAEKNEIMIYEDALYCAETVVEAGFYVTAVYDREEENQQRLKEICACYITGYDELTGVK